MRHLVSGRYTSRLHTSQRRRLEPAATEPRCLQHAALAANSLQVGLQQRRKWCRGRRH